MQRPGPVDPPAPEGVIVLAVELATDAVRALLDIKSKSEHPWHVPAHYPVFAAVNDNSADHCRVTVDVSGATEHTNMRLVGVTLDTVLLDPHSSLFSVAVAGAVTVVAPCDDDALAYAVPGEQLYWSPEADPVGYTTAPAGLKTAKLRSGARALHPDIAAWLDDETGTFPALHKPWIAAVLKHGRSRGLGLLLGKGSEQQNECRVLLSLWQMGNEQ